MATPTEIRVAIQAAAEASEKTSLIVALGDPSVGGGVIVDGAIERRRGTQWSGDSQIGTVVEGLSASIQGGGGTPSSTVAAETAFGQSAAAGSASAYSRGDHTHGTPDDPVPAHASITASVHGSDTSGKFPSTPTLAGSEPAGAVATHAGIAAPHSGHVQIGGQLGGAATSPDVRGLRETAGPTLLALGACADGQYLKRFGSTVVGGTPAGGSNPSWWGVLYSTGNDCDPLEDLREATMGSVAGPTPTAITVSVARTRLFRPPAAMTVSRVRLFGTGATINLYKFAIYPRGTGSAKLWESGTLTTAANTWIAVSAYTPFSLTANTDYWFCVTAAAVGTTAGFRSMAAPLGSIFWGADAAPFGNRALGLPLLAQFAVSAGAFPATLPAIVAAAYGAGTTGSVPFAWLDSVA